MKDEAKTKEQLISELAELRQRSTQLEVLETRHKQTEERIQHLSLVLRAVRNVNQLIVREKGRSRLLQGTCKNIVETPNYHNAWIALLDEHGRLLTYAEAGLGDNFLPMAERLKHGELPACGQRALRQSEVVVTEDPFSTCTGCPLAKKYEGRAAMTVRLEYGGSVFGLLSVSVPAAFITNVEEQSLFREVAGDISFALRSMELEEERKQAEEALREQEGKYRTTFENTGTAMAILEEDATISLANHQFEVLSGYSKQEIEGKKRWTEFVHGEDLERMKEYHYKRREPEGEAPTQYEFRFVNKERNVKHISLTIELIPGTKKSIASLMDITERKQAEELFRALSESSPVGIYIVQDGKFQFVNSQFQRYTGYSENELLGMESLQLVIPEDRNVVKRNAMNMLKGKRSSPYEYKIANKRGEVRWILETVASVQYGGRQATLGNYMDITERKQTEEALRQSEERYRTILEEMEDGYYEVDLAGNYTSFNDATCRAYGYSREEMMGMNYRVYTPKEETERVYKTYNQIYRTGKPNKGFTYEVVRKDGSTGFGELAAFPLRNQEGKIIGFRGVSRDVTERKQAEEALRDSEEKFRSIIEQSTDGVVLTDEQGKVIVYNQAEEQITGLKRDEMLGRPFWEVMFQLVSEGQRGSELLEQIKAQVTEFYKTGQAPWFNQLYENTIQRPDGTQVTIQEIAFPIKTGKGTMICSISRDVTERKAKEEKYRAVIRTAMDGFWQTDMRGRFLDVNEAYCRLIGYRRDELLNMAITDVEAIEKPEETARRIQKIEKVGYDRFETRHRRKDGDIVDVEVSVNYLPTGDGLMFVFVRDITERKRMEEEKGQLERRAQLASRLATVGEMASGIAHEINNPLTGVIGYAQLLMQRQDIPEDAKKDLKVINDGGQRVAGIVNKMLTFARQYKPQRDYVSINDLIANTLDLRAYELKTHNIELITHLDPELPATIADGGQLQQVFLNLIINAETEMDLAHGKGKLSIKTEKIDDTIRISFKDDGSGIAKENMDKIFNPFFTTREVGEGTGLGLSMCHGIIAEHNGRIYAESKLGKGATFVVELPIVTKPEQLELAEPEVEEAEEAAQARILVVDDEPTVLSLVSRVLTGEGHEVETIDNADDALEMIESKRYSLILLDIKMPGMSGTELYKRIHKIAPSLARRILFITGDVIGARTTAFLSRTKAHYIMKPFDAEQLKRAVNRILTA